MAAHAQRLSGRVGATSRALLKFGGGSSDSYATVRAGASTFFVSFDV
jgi:hypothetical protein